MVVADENAAAAIRVDGTVLHPSGSRVLNQYSVIVAVNGALANGASGPCSAKPVQLVRSRKCGSDHKRLRLRSLGRRFQRRESEYRCPSL